MKKQFFFYGLLLIGSCFACKDEVLDLEPLDQATEAIFFKNPEQFKAATNDFYTKMISWRTIDDSNIYDWMDIGSDLTSRVNTYGQGGGITGAIDIYWRNPYKYIRSNNILIQKGQVYTGNKDEIKTYLAEAYFFRAWHHFFLLKRFGGVPILTKVLDVDSPELYSKRATRYEVTKQILSDLDLAIQDLPTEQNIANNDKGHVSKWAAMAFKARVLLYEATWEKYVGESTDFEKNQKKEDKTRQYLEEVVSLTKTVMEQGGYELWDKLGDESYFYLFNLDDALSNPLGFTKASNKEFILKSNYDFTFYRAQMNISHTVTGHLAPSRKMMDMYLCKDGLPPSESTVFKGYAKMTDEFDNRDNRLNNFVYRPLKRYWGYGKSTRGGGANYGQDFPSTILPAIAILNASTSGGYGNRKFLSEHRLREDNQESYDYPQIRLAEVYLIYAEALYERDGFISDENLNISINKIRNRAGVAPLTNALMATHPKLNMLGEIRRERALELFGENFRFDDLKRWNIAEQELNQAILGARVIGTEYETYIYNGKPIYTPSAYTTFGMDAQTGAIVLDPASNRKFSKKNYLAPIPLNQIILNPNLKQNPGW
ncbi:RagB/SusD family nutrient uptake outer membrane protein [Arcicella lustrica]|uniref:RagB/SusD family nutrient uptake outer membrane protein n=1 Tax=Arcicella lustrica TaxID=2984196 RepID=A0ABU5SKV3_9BACT|nr:RagB/SusD family nutrient uptake outer membrane protein [Arcicella sp. DC25W]MEA5427927.1 RagB/SusD family nutrient uptake outer membrane protein [Arcicella sp. DC25W]